jgi:transposase
MPMLSEVSPKNNLRPILESQLALFPRLSSTIFATILLSQVFIDNCSIHKGSEVERLIKKAGAILIHLPPCSPDFSPIENV